MALQTVSNVEVVSITTSPVNAIARREHCHLTADVAQGLGLPLPAGNVGAMNPRRQIRVEVTQPSGTGSTALFTVTEIVAGTNRMAVYPSSGGATGGTGKLFGQSTVPANARVRLRNLAPSSSVINNVLQHTLDYPEPGGSGKSLTEVTRVASTDRVLIMAPHGLDTERKTSDQLAALDAALLDLHPTPSLWDCRGEWGSGETYNRWHIHSDDLAPESFTGLNALRVMFFRNFQWGIALHGFSWDESESNNVLRKGIVLGGRGPRSVKLAIKERIEAKVGTGVLSFYIADPTGNTSFPANNLDLAAYSGIAGLRGLATANIINRLSPTGGIHIEQSLGLRLNDTLRTKVAEAIAEVLHEQVYGTAAITSDQEVTV